MPALSARVGAVMLAMNATSKRKESFSVGRTKGPAPAWVPHTAKADRISATVAVSRSLHRRAAHNRGRTARKESAEPPAGHETGPNANRPTARARMITKAGSDISSRALETSGGRLAHNTSTGVTTRAPARSPSHQVDQTPANPFQLAKPPRARAVTPTVALIGVQIAQAMMVNLPTPHGVLNASAPPAQALSSQAPLTASRVLPAPIASEVASEPAVAALAAMAPARIAGKMR